MTKVKIPLLNILIGLLIIAIVATLYIPTIEVSEEKTISVMGYLSFPTDHKDVTNLFEGLYADFNINMEVWWLLLLQVFGVCSLVLMALYPAQLKSIVLPILFSFTGIGAFCFNRIVYTAGFTFTGIGLMVILLLVSLYNVGFIDAAANVLRRALAPKPASK